MRAGLGTSGRAAACAGCAAAIASLLHCSSDPAPPASQAIPLPDRVPGDDAGDGDVVTTIEDSGATTCDPNEPFGAAVHLAGAWVAGIPYSTPRLSADELTVYFTTRVEAGAKSDLGRAARASRTAPFGAPEIMTALSSPAADNDPSVSADHLSIWFRSDRTGNADLWTATRASTADEWSTPTPVGGVNTSAAEAHVYYRQSAAELWFVSTRADAGNYDIYVAKKAGSAFGTVAPVAALNSTADDFQPQPSEDGLTVLLASNRDGGKGVTDLYIARRASTGAPFGPPAPITELNTPSVEQAGWLSADGCRIYFSSDRDSPGRDALFYAERQPK